MRSAKWRESAGEITTRLPDSCNQLNTERVNSHGGRAPHLVSLSSRAALRGRGRGRGRGMDSDGDGGPSAKKRRVTRACDKCVLSLSSCPTDSCRLQLLSTRTKTAAGSAASSAKRTRTRPRSTPPASSAQTPALPTSAPTRNRRGSEVPKPAKPGASQRNALPCSACSVTSPPPSPTWKPTSRTLPPPPPPLQRPPHPRLPLPP